MENKQIVNRHKAYSVDFRWGSEYGDGNVEGLRSVVINLEAENKFAAALAAWELVKNIVSGLEPDKMNISTRKQCQ